jgi:hypothetical protein
MKNINVRIELTTQPTWEGSQWLQDLRSDLQKQTGMLWEPADTVPSPNNTMAGEILVAIAAAGLALNVFNMVLQMIRYYNERSRRGSITITAAGYNWGKTGLSDSEIEEIVRNLEGEKLKDVIVHVDS